MVSNYEKEMREKDMLLKKYYKQLIESKELY
jgi:hypothetical protein